MTDPETPTSEQITLWLANWQEGDQDAADRLFRVVYPQLRRMAARFLRNERGQHTLEPNALVHELSLITLRRRKSRCAERYDGSAFGDFSFLLTAPTIERERA